MFSGPSGDEARYLAVCAKYSTIPATEVIACMRYRWRELPLPEAFTDRDTLALVDGCLAPACGDQPLLLSHDETPAAVAARNSLQVKGNAGRTSGRKSSKSPARRRSDSTNRHDREGAESTVKTSEQPLLPVWTHLREISFRRCSIGASSAALVASLLERPDLFPLYRLSFQSQLIGPTGLRAIANSLLTTASPGPATTLRILNLNGCTLGDELGEYLLSVISCAAPKGLKMDLGNNFIGYHVAVKLEKAAAEKDVTLLMQGNRVFDEVMSAASHALGCLLCIPACIVMGLRVASASPKPPNMARFVQRFMSSLMNQQQSQAVMVPATPIDGVTINASSLSESLMSFAHDVRTGNIFHHDEPGAEVSASTVFWSSWAYLISLCVLYLGSTLYHSFFTFKTTRNIFEAVDHCAIYLLIAGTYTPILAILNVGPPFMLLAMWTVAFSGILYHIKASPSTTKDFVELGCYMLMGWAAVFCIGDVWGAIGDGGGKLIVLGGLCYTAGVPFFIKAGRTWGMPDHTLWHLFVLGGSATHYFSILYYVIDPHLPVA